MKIAYLVNQYPKVSHSFIRREILALERQGFEVERVAVRGWGDTLVDPEDQRERAHPLCPAGRRPRHWPAPCCARRSARPCALSARWAWPGAWASAPRVRGRST
ncbi:hypothetical protein LP420_06850 [Massilia sp. B-10]|nr:hypothetical protein LP420_06850 [Massilia sp. B-10]